jgi:septum formation topological specificity factor MinE
MLEALKARNSNSAEKATLRRQIIISRFQRLDPSNGSTWAEGPGFYISRLWR